MMFGKHEDGYTLIELMVSIGIMSLLFTLGYASLRDFSRRQALSAVERRLGGELRLAQEKALSGQKPVSDKCDPPQELVGYQFKVVSDSQYVIEANCTGGVVEVKSVSLPAGITISYPTVNPILFRILGEGTNLTASSSSVLTETASGRQVTVFVTEGGEVNKL